MLCKEYLYPKTMFFLTILALEVAVASGLFDPLLQPIDIFPPATNRRESDYLICIVPEGFAFSLAMNSSISTPKPTLRYYHPDDPAHYVNLTDEKSIQNSKFDSSLDTILFMNGFQATPDDIAAINMKYWAMQYRRVNFIIIDWREVAAKTDPTIFMHMQNTGKYVGGLLESMKAKVGLDFSKLYLIAWSLGAQLAGAIANFVKTGKIRKITALDPAAYCFVTYGKSHRLDEGDAEYLVVTTTTAGKVLYKPPLGHLHFVFDNNGIVAKACGDQPSDDDYHCSHSRSVYMYSFTMTRNPKCVLVAYRCNSYDEFMRGKCYSCGDGSDCAMFGIGDDHFESKKTNETAVMYLSTTSIGNGCVFYYSVRVTLENRGKTETGRMGLLVNGTGDCEMETISAKFLLKQDYTGTPKTETFEPGQTYTYLVISHWNVTNVQSISFFWYTAGNEANALYVQCVIIEPMNNILTDRSNLIAYGTRNGDEPIRPDEVIPLTLSSSCDG